MTPRYLLEQPIQGFEPRSSCLILLYVDDLSTSLYPRNRAGTGSISPRMLYGYD
jgi:hypothetical protein